MQWRQGWEEVSNEHLARAGLAVRIDHRSLKAQGLDLEPGRKIGVSRERQSRKRQAPQPQPPAWTGTGAVSAGALPVATPGASPTTDIV